jgi:hypothetical protein
MGMAVQRAGGCIVARVIWGMCVFMERRKSDRENVVYETRAQLAAGILLNRGDLQQGREIVWAPMPMVWPTPDRAMGNRGGRMMARKNDCEDAWGDAVYGAWRSGMNPDRVSRDRVCDDIHAGYDRDDAATREVSRLRRKLIKAKQALTNIEEKE